MPKIRTSNGDIKYKTQIIYWGVKCINKEKAEKNLSDLKKILDEEGIKFMLIAGTLLGAVREKDFITHDEDIDLAFLSEDKQRVFDTLPRIIEKGFEIARYDKRDLLSVIRDGEYIDFYFFRPKNGEKGIRTCSGWLVLDKFLTRYGTLDFKGELYTVPQDYIEYLRCEYGENWRTPIKWFNYKMPWWKKKIYVIKELTKDLLPFSVLAYISKKRESRFEKSYRRNIKEYFDKGGSLE